MTVGSGALGFLDLFLVCFLCKDLTHLELVEPVKREAVKPEMFSAQESSPTLPRQAGRGSLVH